MIVEHDAVMTIWGDLDEDLDGSERPVGCIERGEPFIIVSGPHRLRIRSTQDDGGYVRPRFYLIISATTGAVGYVDIITAITWSQSSWEWAAV